MKIVVDSEEDRDGLLRENLIIDGKVRQYVGSLSECPEDAIIGRALVSCSDIAAFMREAYEAGKRGEAFTLDYKDGVDD